MRGPAIGTDASRWSPHPSPLPARAGRGPEPPQARAYFLNHLLKPCFSDWLGPFACFRVVSSASGAPSRSAAPCRPVAGGAWSRRWTRPPVAGRNSPRDTGDADYQAVTANIRANPRHQAPTHPALASGRAARVSSRRGAGGRGRSGRGPATPHRGSTVGNPTRGSASAARAPRQPRGRTTHALGARRMAGAGRGAWGRGGDGGWRVRTKAGPPPSPRP